MKSFPWHKLTLPLLLLPTLLTLNACENKSETKQLERLPNLTLTGLDGRNETSDKLTQGKVTIINVWATWCPPCRYEMPSLEALHQSLDKKQFQVIGLTVDTDKFLAKEFLGQTGVTFRNFIDPQNVAKQFNVQVFPTTIIVLPDGSIHEYIIGERNWNDDNLKKILQKLASKPHKS